MAIPKMSDEAKRYVDELVQCTHQGLYASELERLSLINMRIVWYFSGGSDEPSVRAHAFTVAVESVLAEAIPPVEGDIIRALLALGRFSPQKLTERYAFVADACGAKDWNEIRGTTPRRHLSRLLIALERQAYIFWERQHPDDYIPYVIKELTDEETPSYRLRDYYVSYVYPPTSTGNRDVIEAREIVAVRETAMWSAEFQYDNSSVNKPKVRFYGDGSFSADEQPTYRANRMLQKLEVTFPTALSPGESARFIIRKSLPLAEPEFYQAPGDINQIWVNPVVPIERYTVQIRHGNIRRPMRSWHFDKIPVEMRPGVYSDAWAIDSTHEGLDYTFHHLRRGVTYGIAWEW